jgi:hypothetical protein
MSSFRSNNAPGHVREMFCDAIEAFTTWNDGEPEPTVEYEVNYEPRQITLSRACGMVWHCTDILGGFYYDWLKDCGVNVGRQTVAAAAQGMLQAIKQAKGSNH